MDLQVVENNIEKLTLNDQMQVSSTGNSEYYYSLIQQSSEDKEKLQQARLRCVLNQLQREREDTSFSRDCLFCRKHFTGNRSHLFEHLLDQHHFLIGNPDNLVFVHELLDHLEQMLKELRCFVCEKVFKDWMTLKEHMRKKQHKKIDPLNKSYDRFYVVNYLESGKTWQDVQKEDDTYSQEDSEEEDMDCAEKNTYICLFCTDFFLEFDQTLRHMKVEHRFDFELLKETHGLNFYQQIKLINYIRRKMSELECISCGTKFCYHGNLIQHFLDTGHSSNLPDPSLWEQPEYYISTFENDNLLCALDDEDADCPEVFPEENPPYPLHLPQELVFECCK